MSKNLTRKGLALGTALAFVVTGLTATAPAYAAAGDVVSIAPTTGTGYGAYNTDYLSINVKIDTDVVTATSYDKLAVELKHTPSAGGSTVKAKFADGLTGVYTAANTCTARLPILKTDTAGTTTAVNLDVTGLTVASADNDAKCQAGIDAAAAASEFTIPFSSTVTNIVLDLASVAGTTASAVSLRAYDAGTTTHENEALAVTSWIDTDEDEVLESTDKFPSKTETATFYDAANVNVTPRIERFIDNAGVANLNGVGSNYLGVSLAFSPELNLDQVVLSNITKTTNASTADVFIPQFLKGKTSHSAAGRIFGVFAETAGTRGGSVAITDGVTSYSVDPGVLDPALALNTAYTFTAAVTAADAAGTGAKTVVTAGYTIAKAATTAVTDDDGVLVNLTSDSAQTSKTDVSPKLRPGVKSFTYTVSTNGSTATENVPVIAQVTAISVATGGSISAGSVKLAKGEATLISGVTDSKGQFSVSVSSDLAKAGESYSVEYFILLNDGSYATSGAFTAAYQAVAVAALVGDSTILSGSTVNAKFSLEDQFGKAISADSAGTAYTLKVTGSNTSNLKQYVTFANGVANVTFTNYLLKGQSDVVTAALGTGTTDTTWVANTSASPYQLTPSLYNPESAAAVTTAATKTAEITYDAFITGTADAVSNVAPSANDDFQLTGTVVDTTGVGIPGAVVTVSAKGLQFVKSATSGSTTYSGDFYKDSITVTADAAGSYEVSVWAHQVSSTGIKITTTSGGKSATTTLKTTGSGASTAGGTSITADDLVFTWNAPKHPAVDTTYIVTGKVTDKWGNPISAAEVTVDADGALEVNGNTSVARKTNASGIFRVYFRSLPKVDGIANITATLTKVVVNGTYLDTVLTTSTTNAPVTSADANSELTAGETFSNVLTSDVNVGVDAAAVAGSKAGTAKVTAYNLKGKTATVYVAGKKVATIKSSAASKSVTVKAAAGAVVKVVVGSTTYFNEAVN